MTPRMSLNTEQLATIRRLAAASTADEAALAYHAFLFAVGNNHAGTYLPVVIDTLPFLEEIIRDGSMFARNATLDALIDLVGSFEPDPAFQSIATGPDEQRLVRDVLREGVAAMDDLITRFALDLSAERDTRERAGTLLDLIRSAPKPG